MSVNSDPQIVQFCHANAWSHAVSEKLNSDASGRCYYRLTKAGKTVVLMDARDIAIKQTLRFCEVADFLRNRGFSTPRIYAKSERFRLALIEDFGDVKFADLMVKKPEKEVQLYQAAIDMLICLRRLRPPNTFCSTSTHSLVKMLDPFFQDYLLKSELQGRLNTLIAEEIFDLLLEHEGLHKTFSLRDCHSENLFILPKRKGIRATGLLDFQDAFLCHPAYDLVSLLQDARRDVSSEMEKHMITYYLARTKDENEKFMRAYLSLGLQRNLRILGVFARLIRYEKKSFYASLIPRVKIYIERTLEEPMFDFLRDDLKASLEKPAFDF